MQMKRMFRGLLAACAAVLAVAASMPAYAAGPVGEFVSPETPTTPGIACGTVGVGKMPGWKAGDRLFKGYLADVGNTYDELNNLNHYTASVNADGFWHICQPWVKVGQSPSTPQPDSRPCPGTQKFAEWTVNGISCTSADPYRSSATDPARFQGRNAGESEAFTATGPRVGHGIFRCEGGKMAQQPGSSCTEALQCAGSVTITWGAACKGNFTGFMTSGKTSLLVNSTPGYTGSAGLYCNPQTMQFQQYGAATCVKN